MGGHLSIDLSDTSQGWRSGGGTPPKESQLPEFKRKKPFIEIETWQRICSDQEEMKVSVKGGHNCSFYQQGFSDEKQYARK